MSKACQNPKSSVFVTHFSHSNVALNFMGRAHDEFAAYGDAYHRAAQALFEKNFKPETFCDLDVLPIGFLYRHALELYLKAIVRRGNALFALNGKGQIYVRQTHSLALLLEDITPIFEFMEWSWDAERDGFHNFADFRKMLTDLEKDEVLGLDDRQGDMWRYPLRKKGDEAHLPVHFSFDVCEYVTRLDVLVAMFAGAAIGLDWALDSACETLSYEQDAYNQIYDAQHNCEMEYEEPDHDYDYRSEYE